MDYGKVLSDVPKEKSFWFTNGNVARNIYELVSELKTLNEYYFKYHSNSQRDDFALWIGGTLGDVVLSEKLRQIKDKNLYILTIEKRIKSLERRHSISVAQHMVSDSISSWMTKHDVLLKIFLILFIVVIGFLGYTQYTSIDRLNVLQQKLTYVEQRDSCFNSYLNQKITSIETQNFTEELTCASNYTFIINDDDLENLPSRISIEDVVVSNNQIIINVKNTTWAVFKNTSSMLPVLNHNTKAIKITPSNPQDIDVGNIISYVQGNEIIAHRVVDKGIDEDGYYFITKGDNNRIVDSERVRFEQINGIVVMLIY